MSEGRYALGEVKNVTDKAVLVVLAEYENQEGKILKTTEGPIWFPKSQISDEDYVVGLQTEFEVASWLMEEKGLV